MTIGLSGMRVPVLRYRIPGRTLALGRRGSVPTLIQRHSRMIARSRRRTMTVSGYSAALRSGEPPQNAVVITLDGEHAEVLDAARRLADQGLTATVFVATSRIGAPGMLRDTDLYLLSGMGIEIGARGHTGRRLDKLPRPDVTAEITLCRRRLAALTGEHTRAFAYPQGGYDTAVRQLVIATGYASACALGEALSHPADDPFALTRLTVDTHLTDQRLLAWLAGVGRVTPRRRPPQAARRTPHRPSVRGRTA